MNAVKLCLIVARGRNATIGADGAIPWRLADDLAFFKRTTMGAPVIMGRKTWESLPVRPLPGRANLVISRNWKYEAPGARVYSSLLSALSVARAIAARESRDEIFVIGGEAIYREALPLADRLYITEVDASPEGDAQFPAVAEQDWVEASRQDFPADERNDHAFVVRVLDRAATA